MSSTLRESKLTFLLEMGWFFRFLSPEKMAIGLGAFALFGLLFLLRTLWRTNALGEGRIARGVLRVEAFLVSMAIASTFVDAIQVSDLSQPGCAVLDFELEVVDAF